MKKPAFPTAADKARRTLLGVAIPRDELAVRMMKVAIGLEPPIGATTGEIMGHVEAEIPHMAETFRRQADAAVLYFAECIRAAKQPN